MNEKRQTMQIKVLVDNNTIIDRYYVGEPAISYLISDEKTKILFDLGYSDIFIKNARQMDESLLDLDFIVVSHGHNDHTGGLTPLIKLYSEAKTEKISYTSPSLVAHPEAFTYKEYEGDEIGSLIGREKINKYFDVKLSREPLWIADNIVFLGEIERGNDFENLDPVGCCEQNGVMVDDYVNDDSAMVYKTDEGLIIITGCSHAGICNIIEHAKKVCDDDRIVDILGGFHLMNPSDIQASGTMKYFENCDIKSIHPCHCTSLKYKIELSKLTNVNEVGVGLELQF